MRKKSELNVFSFVVVVVVVCSHCIHSMILVPCSSWFCASMTLQCNIRILVINNQLFYVGWFFSSSSWFSFSWKSIGSRTRNTLTRTHINNSYFLLIFPPFLFAPTCFFFSTVFWSNKHFFVFLLHFLYVNKRWNENTCITLDAIDILPTRMCTLRA